MTTTGANFTWGDTSTSATTITINSIDDFSFQTPNVKGGIEVNKAEGIGPKLYFKFVKSKLNKLEKEKLKKRLFKLHKLIQMAEESGQQASYEELCKMLAVVVRQSEAYVAGYDKMIDIKDIDKFRQRVKDKVVKFRQLEYFPRAIPAKVRTKIVTCKKKQLFDKYWVLFIDYSGEELKTNKEKIREKDPILFGQYDFQVSKYYYITDWVDEYCDLTLEQMVDTIKEDDEEYALGQVPELTNETLEDILKAVNKREDRLDKTNPTNYKDLMKEEDKKEPVKKKKIPWYKFWGWKRKPHHLLTDHEKRVRNRFPHD